MRSQSTTAMVPERDEADFYASLKPFDRFADVANPAVYARVPESWMVLITDVKGSTKAIEAGRYKDVNALGVSTITAVLNEVRDTQIPYVFGGDGATMVVPPTHVEAVKRAAQGAQALARDAFNMELRAGMVPIRDLAAAGTQVRVARFKVSEHICLAMFEGGGLAHAEQLIKDPLLGGRYALTPAQNVQPGMFQGFECRWQPIPARKDRILSLLVVALSDAKDEQRRIYREVLEGIHGAARSGEEGLRPVHESTLALSHNPKAFQTEALMRVGRPRGLAVALRRLKIWLLCRVAGLLMATGLSAGSRQGRFNGSTYKAEVAANTDFRKFDDTLRMVIDVSDAEQSAIESYLTAQRAAGRIAYGTHSSAAALMTCLIRDFSGNHLHFVDGSDGGYALAAKQLKQQLKERKG